MKCTKCGVKLAFTFKNIFIINGILVVKCEKCETVYLETEIKNIEKIYWEEKTNDKLRNSALL